MTCILTLNKISVNINNKKILKKISCCIYNKKILTIIGPNGAGKSTLIKVILGLIKPNSGKIIFNKKLRIGYVPQKIFFNPILPITVKYFLYLKSVFLTKNIKIFLKYLNINKLLNKSIQKISYGEMQKVLLARSLLNNPNLLLLDEPAQGIDINGQITLYNLINKIRKHINCSILIVSHDLHLVMAQTDYVLCINNHMCCSGTPKVVSKHPIFINTFGKKISKKIAIYSHKNH